MLRVLFVLACLFLGDLAAATYANLTSLTTITPTSSKGSLVKFDSVEAIKGFDLASAKNKLIVKQDGMYFIIISAQIGATSPEATGYVDVWLSKNGKPIPNSTGRTAILDSTATYTLVIQSILPLKNGDMIENYLSASGPSLGCIYMQPDNEPALSSYQLVIIKIDEL
jgi:hypothetical protein